MTGIGRSLRRFGDDARNAFRQAPLEVAIGFLVAALFSYALEREDGLEPWAPIAVFAVVALPLVFGCTLLHARGRVGVRGRWAGTVLAVTAVALYAFVVFDAALEAEAWRAALLAVAAVLLLSLLPALDAGMGAGATTSPRRWFWRFNARLAARLATVVAYGFALFLGLAAALGSVTALFDLEVRGVAYAHLFGWIAFALVPWIVVGGVPALAAEPEPVTPPARRFIRWLDAYLLAPLLVTYAVILHAYVIRIVVVGEVPRNVLSPLVLGAGLLWLAADFLFDPLRDAPDENSVLSGLVRFYPLALLPMVALGVWAVGVRVGQYGWTEFRYIRVAVFLVLGILGVLAGVRILRRRAPPLIEVSVLFAAVLLLSAAGPWGALAVSRRRQQARLAEVIESARRAGAPADVADAERTGAAAPIRVPAEHVREIDGAARYLARHFGAAAVEAVAPGAGEAAERGSWRFAAAMGFLPASELEPMIVVAGLPDSIAVPGVVSGTWYRVRLGFTGRWLPDAGCLEMPDRFRRIPAARRDSTTRHLAGITFALDTAGHRVRAVRAGTELVGDLTPLVLRIAEASHPACPDGPRLAAAEARVDLRDAAGRRRGQLILTRIGIRVPAAGDSAAEPRIQGVEGHLVIAPR